MDGLIYLIGLIVVVMAIFRSSACGRRAMTIEIETAPTVQGPSGVQSADQWTLQWTPIIAGAFTACVASSIMITFGAIVGLGVSSTAPTWRDTSIALWVLSGLYLTLVSLVCFGCGGYIAGRTRAPYDGIATEDTEKRDGLHGVAAWALAVILGTALRRWSRWELVGRPA